MKKFTTVGAALMLTTTAAYAGSLDRSNQAIGVIFEDGQYSEFSIGKVMPSLSGTDAAVFGGSGTSNVADDFTQMGLAYKMDINDKTSFAVIFDQPYGANIAYPTFADGGSVALGGTKAMLESKAITALARYKLNDNFSVHGGVRAETIAAGITLGGVAYGDLLNGYTVDLAQDTAYGYSIGGAYERKDIALRVALTYHSSITHDFATTENGAASLDTTVETPQAINLDFQSGVAANTLVFGSIRWAEYSKLIVSPAGFSSATDGASLTNVEDSTSYTLGVGRKFSDSFSGSISIGYEAEGKVLVSPLAPSNGNYSVGLGGEYTMDKVSLSAGVRYIVPGDAEAQTGGVSRASFKDNSAVAVGFKIAYTY